MNYCPRCQTDGKVLHDRAYSKLLRSDWPKTIEELVASGVSGTGGTAVTLQINMSAVCLLSVLTFLIHEVWHAALGIELDSQGWHSALGLGSSVVVCLGVAWLFKLYRVHAVADGLRLSLITWCIVASVVGMHQAYVGTDVKLMVAGGAFEFARHLLLGIVLGAWRKYEW